MKLAVRTVAFAAVVFTVHAASIWWHSTAQPEPATALAVRQLNGSGADARQLRWFDAQKNELDWPPVLIVGAAALLCFGGTAREIFSRRQSRAVTLLPLAAGAFLFSGCIKPYDTPEFATIDTAETGFLIPLEGDGRTQDKFDSEDYLRQLKVAAKRVQITHRWQQTGRMSQDGQWIPVVRLIKVERSPVTREWTADAGTGTAHANQAIWIESADSVAFSMGFTCTAFIAEENAAKFLYWYPSGSLAHVMDSEVRARIQQVAAEVAAKYPLDDLRARKQEIMDGVRTNVSSFFTQRGVTITTVGMFGGMTYENPEIQKSIDKTFIAQQEKVVNQARFEAQQRENDRVELEAQALAEKVRRAAQGEADAKNSSPRRKRNQFAMSTRRSQSRSRIRSSCNSNSSTWKKRVSSAGAAITRSTSSHRVKRPACSSNCLPSSNDTFSSYELHTFHLHEYSLILSRPLGHDTQDRFRCRFGDLPRPVCRAIHWPIQPLYTAFGKLGALSTPAAHRGDCAIRRSRLCDPGRYLAD